MKKITQDNSAFINNNNSPFKDLKLGKLKNIQSF